MEVRESAWLQQHYRKALSLCAAFGAGVPLLVLAGEVMLRQGGDAGMIPGPWLIITAAFSLALLPAIALVRRRMLGGGPGLHAVVDQVMVPQNRYRRMLEAVLVSMAMCTVPALLGLGLVLMGAGRSELYLAVGWSVVLFALYVPRYRQWQEWFAQRSHFR